MSHRRTTNGFTLVELLVALAIFALVSLAGVGLLRASITTQGAVQDRLTHIGDVERLRAILASELGAAQPRGGRDANGNLRPAMSGSGEGIAFTVATSDGVHRFALARDGDAILIGQSDRLDGAEPTLAPLIREVATLRLRYRAADGQWLDDWQPNNPAALPKAVELTVEPLGQAAITIRLPVAPDGVADGPAT